MSYTYSKSVVNGLTMHVMKSSPKNIVLKSTSSNLANVSDYGINGGFFYGSDLLSIAVNNDVPVRGVPGGYGSGWINEKYARGTLVWDGAASRYSVQTVKNAAEIDVNNRGNYWAQAGISMSLQDDTNWKSIATAQNMPNMTGSTTRTALVYNSGLNIFLVVTNTACTAEAFRKAVKQLGSGTIVDGVFLDGSGSSQMKCSETVLKGDGRIVRQMVALIEK